MYNILALDEFVQNKGQPLCVLNCRSLNWDCPYIYFLILIMYFNTYDSNGGNNNNNSNNLRLDFLFQRKIPTRANYIIRVFSTRYCAR